MGHTLPRALNAPGSFVFPLETAVEQILRHLYQNQPPNKYQQTGKAKTKHRRNTEIRDSYARGVTIRQLAEQYALSQQRIHQIIHGKRK